MASTSRIPAAVTNNNEKQGDTADERAKAIDSIYGYFTTGGVAYTRNDTPTLRHYCTACLEKEIESVRTARQQFGQGTNASIDVLRGIAMGRLEFFLPRYNILLDHLRKYCPNLARPARKETQAIHLLLNSLPGTVYRNPYDYGSVYEGVAYPKYAGKDKDLLIPGAGSPANIYRAHEEALLQRAKRKRYREVRKRAAQAEEGPNGTDNIQDEESSATENSESENEDEQERAKRMKLDKAIDPSLDVDRAALFDAGAGGDKAVELPDGFPESELLKALQAHSASLYSARGLMSTEAHPKDATGAKIPSMIQAMDGSALIALGISIQELVRASVLPSSTTTSSGPTTQPISDFYPRTAGKKKGWAMEEGGKKQPAGVKRLTDRILRALPEGSEVGIRDLVELSAGVEKEREGFGEVYK